MQKNHTQVFMHSALPGMALLHASFVDQHYHETYSIGVVLSGVNRFLHRGSSHYACANHICVVNPGDVHTGDTCDAIGWNYINIYPSEELLGAARHALGLDSDPPYFPHSIISDMQTAQALQHLAFAISQSASALEVEHRWLAFCALLFSRHTLSKGRPDPRVALPHHITLARDALDASLSENVSLTALAELCGASPYHLARSFTSHVGLPPHAYHLQKRIEYAKVLIQDGFALADAAMATGFADQAHMTRHFRRHLGVTPGQLSPLRKNVQYRQ